MAFFSFFCSLVLALLNYIIKYDLGSFHFSQNPFIRTKKLQNSEIIKNKKLYRRLFPFPPECPLNLNYLRLNILTWWPRLRAPGGLTSSLKRTYKRTKGFLIFTDVNQYKAKADFLEIQASLCWLRIPLAVWNDVRCLPKKTNFIIITIIYIIIGKNPNVSKLPDGVKFYRTRMTQYLDNFWLK